MVHRSRRRQGKRSPHSGGSLVPILVFAIMTSAGLFWHFNSGSRTVTEEKAAPKKEKGAKPASEKKEGTISRDSKAGLKYMGRTEEEWLEDLYDTNTMTAYLAVCALSKIATEKSARAMPRLREIDRDAKFTRIDLFGFVKIKRIFIRIGPQAIPFLEKLVKSPKDATSAINALTGLSPASKKTISVVERFLKKKPHSFSALRFMWMNGITTYKQKIESVATPEQRSKLDPILKGYLRRVSQEEREEVYRVFRDEVYPKIFPNAN